MRAAGRVLLYVDAVLAVLFGLRYATARSVTPYHAAFIGAAGGEVPPAYAALLLLLYKVIGFGFVSLGALCAILAAPATRGDRAAWWALLVTGSLSLVPLIAVTFAVGHGSPWWAPPLAYAMLVAGLALGRIGRG
jgi:hypothetical protein